MIHPHAHKSVAHKLQQFFDESLIVFEDNGRGNNYPLALAIFGDVRNHIIYAIATHLVARYWRKGVSHAGVEELEVVVNLGCSTHRRTRVTSIYLLLYGDGRCNT